MLLKASLRLIALAAVMLVASLASAAPARVKVFEAQARSGTRADSRILYQFPENTELSVSEDVDDDGWRRVRLPDGKTGYIKDSQIELVGKPKSAEPAPGAKKAAAAKGDDDDDEDEAPARKPAPPAPKASEKPSEKPSDKPKPAAGQARDDDAPKALRLRAAQASDVDDPRSRVAVKREALTVEGITQLAELTKDDPVVGTDTERLLRRRNIGLGIGIGGGIVGFGILVGGFTFVAEQDCRGFSTACTSTPNWTAVAVGGGMALLSGLATWLLWPRQSELAESVDTWNQRHPSSQLELMP